MTESETVLLASAKQIFEQHFSPLVKHINLISNNPIALTGKIKHMNQPTKKVMPHQTNQLLKL
jgi:hypothetical protein